MFCMPLVLSFVKMSGIKDRQNPIDSAIKPVINLMIGPYLRVEIIVYSSTDSSMYHIPTGGTFRKSTLHSTCLSDDTHDLLYVALTDDEEQKIRQTCEACVASKKSYNFRDVLLQGVPFRQPEERTIFQATQLYCAQSVVLILRECLSSSNHLTRVLWGVHSRTVTPNTLYEEIAQHCVVMNVPTFFNGLYPVDDNDSAPVSASLVQESTGLKPVQKKHTKSPISTDQPWDKW